MRDRIDVLTVSLRHQKVLGGEGWSWRNPRERRPMSHGTLKNGFDKWDFPHYISTMTTKLTLDRAGRVLIPKTLRKELHLGPGDSLQLNSEGEEITLRPVRPKALLKKEQGVWVYQGEATHASIPDLIDREREKRSRELMG